MKNVFLILLLMGGFAVSGVFAQNCVPCPPCPACPKGCCMAANKNSASASAQIVPATLDLSAACTPEMMAACQGEKKMTKKEMKACQSACTSGAPSACTSGTPSACQSSTAKATPVAGEAVDQQYHKVKTPQKS